MNLINNLYNLSFEFLGRVTLLLICIFIITRIQSVRHIFIKENYKLRDYIVISAVFSFLAIFATYTGLNVEGSLINVRIITIVTGGVVFGPIVGITAGIASGIHRYLIDINGVTSTSCLISSIVAGIASGYVYKKSTTKFKWAAAIAVSMLCEILTMILIILLNSDHKIGIEIVSQIGFPMVFGDISVGLVLLLVDGVEDEKDRLAAKQAKLSLDIANKSLPYFRNINEDSLNEICTIIKEYLNADAVAITDREYILAYSGVGVEYYAIGSKILTEIAKEAINENKIIVRNNGFSNEIRVLQSAIILPLREKNEVIGCLKIYYIKENKITQSIINLTTGLSEIMSTLMEISKIEKIRKMADKAELKALQRQINPHFLFNSLNVIASSIRINPAKARELIINLSNYLRFNLEVNDEFISINKELGQVRNYIEIVKARFGEKIDVEYEIDSIDIKIPSLIIEPLVENAVVHGILKNSGKGNVKVIIKKDNDKIKVSILDDGIGIDQKVIDDLYNNNLKKNKIGLYNVDSRLKLIYGQGLIIRKLAKGTSVEFYIRG